MNSIVVFGICVNNRHRYLFVVSQENIVFRNLHNFHQDYVVRCDANLGAVLPRFHCSWPMELVLTSVHLYVE